MRCCLSDMSSAVGFDGEMRPFTLRCGLTDSTPSNFVTYDNSKRREARHSWGFGGGKEVENGTMGMME